MPPDLANRPGIMLRPVEPGLLGAGKLPQAILLVVRM
jgi:hypothetical protein